MVAQGAELRLLSYAAKGEQPYASVEEKILRAEYALDFAMQAADRALLLSLKAIEAQTRQQEQDEGSLI